MSADPIAEGQDARSRNQRYELNQAEGAVRVAQVAVQRLRTHLAAGLVDSVAAMLESDLESAGQRLAWLRERLDEEAQAA